MLRAIDGYKGNLTTCGALRLAPPVFLRPINLRKLRWEYINLTTAKIRLPGRLLKMREDLIVPLARQGVAILQEILPLTHKSGFVFPGERNNDRPMSENTYNGALRRLNYSTAEEMTGHGFRAMARTILDEVLGLRVEWIDMQLAHKVKDPNARAYNRTAFLKGPQGDDAALGRLFGRASTCSAGPCTDHPGQPNHQSCAVSVSSNSCVQKIAGC